MKKICIMIVLAIILTACAAPTITPTLQPTSTNTPEPTPIPLSEIDLEPILLLSGDLPTDFQGGQITTSIIKRFENMPDPEQAIAQSFRAGDYGSDGINIYLYKSETDLLKAKEIVIASLQQGDKFEEISDVGEWAIGSEEQNTMFYVTDSKVVFIRCNALVYIELFSKGTNLEVSKTYAQRIDKRLKGLICPEKIEP